MAHYSFCTNIPDPVLNDLIIIPDFECEVDVDFSFRDGNPEATCTEVYLDGQPLRDGSELTRQIRLKVMQAADENLAAGGSLWDDVAAREGVWFSGSAGDPDAHWQVAL